MPELEKTFADGVELEDQASGRNLHGLIVVSVLTVGLERVDDQHGSRAQVDLAGQTFDLVANL